MTIPPGTRSVTANQLKIGDIILNDDGSYDATVEDVWVDYDNSSQTWLDDGNSAGYLGSYQQFLIEWDES